MDIALQTYHPEMTQPYGLDYWTLNSNNLLTNCTTNCITIDGKTVFSNLVKCLMKYK